MASWPIVLIFEVPFAVIEANIRQFLFGVFGDRCCGGLIPYLLLFQNPH